MLWKAIATCLRLGQCSIHCVSENVQRGTGFEGGGQISLNETQIAELKSASAQASKAPRNTASPPPTRFAKRLRFLLVGTYHQHSASQSSDLQRSLHGPVVRELLGQLKGDDRVMKTVEERTFDSRKTPQDPSSFQAGGQPSPQIEDRLGLGEPRHRLEGL